MLNPQKFCYHGSLHLLTDAFYPGPAKITVKPGVTVDCHFLLLLFSKKCKTGAVINRFRRIKISSSCEEFRLFWKAFFDQEMTGEIDCKEFAEQVVTDIAQNTYNFRIQFASRPEIPKIEYIKKTKCLESRGAGMIWPKQAVAMYPVLKENNIQLEQSFGNVLAVKLKQA